MPAFVRDLSGVVHREEDAKMGGLICLEPPTKGMLKEVASGGIYPYQGRDYHRLQIRTIQDLLDGKWFDTPSMVRTLGKSSQTIMPVWTFDTTHRFLIQKALMIQSLLKGRGIEGVRLINNL